MLHIAVICFHYYVAVRCMNMPKNLSVLYLDIRVVMIISNAAISIFEHVFFIGAHNPDGIYLELLGHSSMLKFNK